MAEKKARAIPGEPTCAASANHLMGMTRDHAQFTYDRMPGWARRTKTLTYGRP
ncbi:MAG: hypothetical protein R6V51_05315 [Dehalococcoidia bacterium]